MRYSATRLFMVIAALTIGVGPAWSRCACLDTVDEQARKASEAAALSRLPSEADLGLARGFQSQGIVDDAKTYFGSAAEKAQTEIQDAFQKLDAGQMDKLQFAMTTRHGMNVQNEASSYFLRAGDFANAANTRELLLQNQIKAGSTDDLAQQYRLLASLYTTSGNLAKAADYQKLLAEHFATTKGRYSAEAKHSQSAYLDLLAKVRKSAISATR